MLKTVKIGSVEITGNAVLAPMAGVCNEAFREICKENGANLIFTEMVNNTAIVHQNSKSLKMTIISPNERPAVLQIFGSDLPTFIEAAKYVDQNSDCDIIDINMGCPVPKIALSCQAGASLMKDPQKIFDIVKAVTSVVSKPVTIKIRLGWDENSINCVEVAKLAEQAGASAISIHARTRSQMYTGKARWEWIKAVKQAVSIPVIGNGDVFKPEDAKAMLEQTGCDLVMVGRASQGNPWIFKQINDYLETGSYEPRPDFEAVFKMIIDHAERLIKLKGEKIAITEMRGHVAHYVKGFPDAKQFKISLVRINNLEELKNILVEYTDFLKYLPTTAA